MDLLDKSEYKFIWITEFPLLEWSEEENRYTAMHHPFTMPMEEDLQYIDSDPGRVRAKAYDIVLNGNEIGGAEASVSLIRRSRGKMFEVLGFTPERAQEQFGFLLTAFKYGGSAPRRPGLRPGPPCHAHGKAGQHPRRDCLPQGEGRLRPHDRGSHAG